MPYRKLYRKRQEVNQDYQPRGWYADDARQLSWVSNIAIKATEAMPFEGLSGFIVRHAANAHSLEHQYTIVVAEGLDKMTPYMERFVVIKELMHCYFACDHGSATDSQLVLETHMRQFFGKSATSQSLHVRAEYQALWMAIGVLCPERVRLDCQDQLARDPDALNAISHRLRAPPHIVQLLLSDQFEDEIRDILN